MRTIATNIDETTFEAMMLKCDELNVNRSEYLRNLICKDVNPVVETEPKISMLDRLKQAFGTSDITVVKSQMKSRVRRNFDKNDVWIPLEAHKKPYLNCFIRNNMIMGHGKKDKVYPTRWSIDEVLMVRELFLLQHQFLNKHIGSIVTVCNKQKQSVQRMCWNIESGNLEELIKDYKSQFTLLNFGKLKGKIIVNGIDSKIPTSLAKEMISIVTNSSNYEVVIWDLQRTYSKYDAFYIRAICENYCNPHLLRLLESKQETHIENNPSKRRNLIRNGGMI